MHESKEGVLLEQLMCGWQILYDEAMQLTSTSADVPYIEQWFSRGLDRWADSELRILKEWKDLTQPKQVVAEAFSHLLAARQQAGNTFGGDPERCVCCGEPLSQGLFNDRGCLKCAAPVTDALTDLIRASTDRFTPEYLYEFWSSAKHRTK